MSAQQQRQNGVQVLAQDLVATVQRGDIALPMLPTAAVSVYRASQSPDPDLGRIASIVEQDQSLSAEVLKVANSTAFWPRAKITSVTQAATRLGLKRLTRITFTAALSASMFNAGVFQNHMNHYRNVSLASALWNRKLAVLRNGDIEHAFLNGLMRNVGRPAALRVVASHFKGQTGTLLDHTLEQLVSVLHRPLGTLLGNQWALPPSTQACIQFHGLTLPNTHSDEVAASYCAALLAKATMTQSEIDLDALAEHPAVHSLALRRAQLELLSAQQAAVYRNVLG